MDYRTAKICGGILDGKPCGWIYDTPRCPRCAGSEAIQIQDLMLNFLALVNELDSQTPQPHNPLALFGPVLKPKPGKKPSTPNPRT